MNRPGLIRWNFFSYLILFALIGLAYIVLGLDGHLKTIMEQKLASLNGAPVLIDKASFGSITRFWLHNPMFSFARSVIS